MTLVSIITPTMNRWWMLEKSLASLEASLDNQENTVEYIAVVDVDRETLEGLQNFKPTKFQLTVLFNSLRRGAIACWNQGLAVAQGTLFVLGNDDLLFQSNWLDEAVKVHTEALNGYGVVGLNDTHFNGVDQCCFPMVDRQFCIDHLNGVIAYPVYQFCANDTETHKRAVQAGRYAWAEKSVVVHAHSDYGLRPVDDNDRRQHPVGPSDSALYSQREAAGFPNNFEPVLK